MSAKASGVVCGMQKLQGLVPYTRNSRGKHAVSCINPVRLLSALNTHTKTHSKVLERMLMDKMTLMHEHNPLRVSTC